MPLQKTAAVTLLDPTDEEVSQAAEIISRELHARGFVVNTAETTGQPKFRLEFSSRGLHEGWVQIQTPLSTEQVSLETCVEFCLDHSL